MKRSDDLEVPQPTAYKPRRVEWWRDSDKVILEELASIKEQMAQDRARLCQTELSARRIEKAIIRLCKMQMISPSQEEINLVLSKLTFE